MSEKSCRESVHVSTSRPCVSARALRWQRDPFLPLFCLSQLQQQPRVLQNPGLLWLKTDLRQGRRGMTTEKGCYQNPTL